MLFKKQELSFEAWAESMELSHLATWLLPQLVAWYGNWKLIFGDDKIDCLATIKHNCPCPQTRAFYTLSRIKRSILVSNQTRSPDYATLTPLILMGQKRMRGVSYESWRTARELGWMLEPRLYEAIMLDSEIVDAVCSLGSQRLIEIRDQGLLARTGVKAGQIKPAKSTWSLTGIQSTELGSLPKLTQTILTQCWLAHPESRTSYMMLDLQDWDSMPQPLVTNDIFKAVVQAQPTTKKQPKEKAELLPWDL
jgi:hypothetical protein